MLDGRVESYSTIISIYIPIFPYLFIKLQYRPEKMEVKNVRGILDPDLAIHVRVFRPNLTLRKKSEMERFSGVGFESKQLTSKETG